MIMMTRCIDDGDGGGGDDIFIYFSKTAKTSERHEVLGLRSGIDLPVYDMCSLLAIGFVPVFVLDFLLSTSRTETIIASFFRTGLLVLLSLKEKLNKESGKLSCPGSYADTALPRNRTTLTPGISEFRR